MMRSYLPSLPMNSHALFKKNTKLCVIKCLLIITLVKLEIVRTNLTT